MMQCIPPAAAAVDVFGETKGRSALCAAVLLLAHGRMAEWLATSEHALRSCMVVRVPQCAWEGWDGKGAEETALMLSVLCPVCNTGGAFSSWAATLAVYVGTAALRG